ncbi:MAG: ABC transporter substrate-binding protein [Candidatus Dojkabacteria bacterium]
MNDKSKKILIIGGIVIFVLMVITAVVLILNKDKTTDNNNGNTSSTLVYWGLWEPSSVMQPLIDEFESLNPGTKIQYSQQNFSNYESRIFTRLEQSTNTSEPAPDIFRVHNSWIPKYYKYITPLPSSVMTSTEYSNTFYPTAVEDFTAKNGNIYAIPWEIDGLMVYYNKQLLAEQGVEKPPQDWDSFFELAQKLTKRDAAGRITQAGLAMGTSKNIKHSAEIISFLLLQEGANLIDETKTVVTLNTPKGVKVFRTYTDLAMGDSSVWSSTLPNDLEMFFAGNLAMMIGPSWRSFDIIEAAPTIEFETAALPQLKANTTEVYFSSYWGDSVSKTCANPTLAWKFVKFLSEKEQQLKLYSNSSKIRAYGEPYSLVELNSSMKDKAYVSAIAEMAPKMKAWQMGDESFVKSTINQVVTDILETNADISVSLKKAETLINEKLAVSNK